MDRERQFIVKPDPEDGRLTRLLDGVDQDGAAIEARVVEERPLTLFLNGQEIVTVMTIRDYPRISRSATCSTRTCCAMMTRSRASTTTRRSRTVVVRTRRATDFEETLRKKTLTSGCAQGTVFGDLMERFEATVLDPDARLKTSWLYALSRAINMQPSLYLAAGAIHGCVLCEEGRPLVYMEDVGRHNAIDKIAGYMFENGIGASGKIMYTTGRLTSEMVIKTVTMGIPILISRSGFTAWGVELAREAGLTLVGRARGKRFIALAGAERLVYDADASSVAEEAKRHRRKGSVAAEDAA